MIGNNTLEAVAVSLASLIASEIERIFGPVANIRAIGPVSWGELGAALTVVVLTLLLNWVAVWLLGRRIRRTEAQPGGPVWRPHALRCVRRPLQLLIWVFGVYLTFAPLLRLATANDKIQESEAEMVFAKLCDLGWFIALVWGFLRLTRVLETHLASWAAKTETRIDDLVVPLLVRSLRLIVPVLGIILIFPVIGLPRDYSGVVATCSSILIIAAVAWILFQGVHLGEKAVLAEYDITAADNLQARKVYTQVHVLSKTLYVIISIFTAASILMLFEQVRRFGTSLLASAGVVGVIAGFAAQRTIANLFAGFQLAMTQPIRLDDVVIVEGEWGRIEEITLTYVVVHIWDDRRLIVPLSYFIEKPFQNWTRVSAELLGSVFVWADYSLPLNELRDGVRRIVESCKDWDHRFWNVQVTDTTDRAMQIRVLATAADSSKAWDLRCEIREKLLGLMQERYPGSLPRTRAELDGGEKSRLLQTER